MPKNSVADWDTTAANNTDVGGVNLAPGTALVSAMDNALRVMMAQIKATGVGANTTFIKTLLDDPDAATALLTLGAVASLADVFRQGVPVVFTSSGTYTRPAGCSTILSRVWGGGGGGGGCNNANYGASGGGAAGGYSELFIANTTSSYAVTVGAAGAGGSASSSGNNGGNGGTSSFGSSNSATGGSGGAGDGGGATLDTAPGGSGGSGAGGNFNGRGHDGAFGWRNGTTSARRHGIGGAGHLGIGFGGRGNVGEAGSGGAGSPGGAGLVVVTPFYL